MSDVNRRRSERFPFMSDLEVAWQTKKGAFRRVRGVAVDGSSRGLQLELPEPVEVGTRINIACQSFHALSSASVCYCRQVEGKWRIGVEFSRGLVWLKAFSKKTRGAGLPAVAPQ